MIYFEELSKFIDEFNSRCKNGYSDENKEFFDFCELEMAKAFLCDYSEMAVRVSKMILALKDVNDIKIKIE